jgi:4-aminobutyrate aminotransferase-like enzyme
MLGIKDRIKRMANHTFGTWNWQKNWKVPLLISGAEGIYFYDSKGKPYIDFSSQ